MHFISKHRLASAVGAAAVLAGAFFFLRAFPRLPAMKPALQQALLEAEGKGETIPVIVELEEGIFRVLSAGKNDALESVQGFAAKLSPDEVRQALTLQEVRAVHFDAAIRTGEFHAEAQRRGETEEGNDAETSSLLPPASSPFLRSLGADQMHRWGLDGTGVAVAVVDSGIADLPGLNVVARVDFTGEEGSGLDPYGHGTHVAGILGFHAEAQRRRGAKRQKRVQNLQPTVFSLQPPCTESLQASSWST